MRFIEFIGSVWKRCNSCDGTGRQKGSVCGACNGEGGIDTGNI